MNKFILLLICSLIISCSENKNQKSDNTEITVHWSNASIIKNKALNAYLNLYSIDNPSDILMFIGQYRDTIIATISQLKIDINLNQLQPVAYVNINNRKIFILMPISFLIENDSLSVVQRNFKLSIDSIAKKNYKYSNIVLIKIPMYNDTIIECKDREKIPFYFQPTIKSD